MKPLTNRQQAILRYIEMRVSEKGFPPSIREICEAVGLNSPSTVHGHINTLVKRGLLKKEASKPRAIGVVGREEEKKIESNVIAPILGRVAAGQPIATVEEREEVMVVPSFIRAKTESFVLRVTGESMIKAGIYDKDYIVVNKQEYADNGDIVVAMIEDEVTVKRFFKERDRIRLQPENDEMEPMYFTEVRILGKVVGLHRVIE